MTEQSRVLLRCFPKPSLVAYKRAKNLKDILIKARLSTKRKSARICGGFRFCGRFCMVCKTSKRTMTHKCHKTGQEWKITAPINCETTNVVYKLECRRCPGFVYIGETQRRFCDRVAEHRGYVTQKKLDHPVGRHFNQGIHSVTDLCPTAIEKVHPEGNTLLRRRREKLWINRYDAVAYGANTRE